jgi:hypothetical protein
VDLLETPAAVPAAEPEPTVENVADRFGDADEPFPPEQAPLPDTPQNAMDPLVPIQAKIANCPAASALNNIANGLVEDHEAGVLDDLQYEQCQTWVAERRKALSPRGERSKNKSLIEQ